MPTFTDPLWEFSESAVPTVSHTLPNILISPEGRITGVLAVVRGQRGNGLVEEAGQTGGALLLGCSNAGLAARPALLTDSGHTLELRNSWAGGHAVPIWVGHQVIALQTAGCSRSIAPIAEGVAA